MRASLLDRVPSLSEAIAGRLFEHDFANVSRIDGNPTIAGEINVGAAVLLS